LTTEEPVSFSRSTLLHAVSKVDDQTPETKHTRSQKEIYSMQAEIVIKLSTMEDH
jgi:hypothetical protein